MRNRINERLTTVFAVIIFIMAVLAWRITEIQIINGEELAEKARKQQVIMIKMPEEEKGYIYIMSRSRVEKSPERGRLYEIAEELELERIRKDDKGRLIYVSRFYDEKTGSELEKKFGTLVIESAGNTDNRLYVYADREGDLMPGLRITDDELSGYE